MIRFVGLGTQLYPGTECRDFAFYDTIVDRFVTLGGTQTWQSWIDFKDDLEADTETEGIRDIERYKALCDPWVFTQPSLALLE